MSISLDRRVYRARGFVCVAKSGSKMTACGRRARRKSAGMAWCLLRKEGSIPRGSRVDDVDRSESIERTLDYKDSKRGDDSQLWSTLSSWPEAGVKQGAQGYVEHV